MGLEKHFNFIFFLFIINWKRNKNFGEEEINWYWKLYAETYLNEAYSQDLFNLVLLKLLLLWIKDLLNKIVLVQRLFLPYELQKAKYRSHFIVVIIIFFFVMINMCFTNRILLIFFSLALDIMFKKCSTKSINLVYFSFRIKANQ